MSNRTGGQSYGSWGAQAQQLQMALKNGGEHPSCPRQVLRKDKDPCFTMAKGGEVGRKGNGHQFTKPSAGDVRVCDSDCKRLPMKMTKQSNHKWTSGPAGGMKCGLRYLFPTMFGPDTALVDSNQGEYWGNIHLGGYAIHAYDSAFAFWQCSFAGYNLGAPPKWGPDPVDAQYLAQNYNLYRTDLFGRDICSENRGQHCGGRIHANTVNNVWIPGCRTDMWPHTTCAGGGFPRGTNSQCVCNDWSKKPDEPNFIRRFDAGVDTCNRGEMEQGAFECLGILRYLEPGESLKWGFRCKTNEAMQPYAHNKWSSKMPCPKGGLNCKASNWDHRTVTKPIGRFSPGKGKVAACIRPALRCNGFCNCGDCSDEDSCDNLPKVLDTPYMKINWDTKLRCRHGNETKPFPKGVIDCYKHLNDWNRLADLR